MDSNSPKILVLSDLKDTMNSTIKNAVSLAKIINGNLYVFHVKKPTEIVEQESQLSAMRSINQSFISISKEMKGLIEPLAKDYDVAISYNHVIGHIKTEILGCIASYNPDIIVMGKRKKSISLLGDAVTDLVIDNFNGAIMIASEDQGLEPNSMVSLGVLNNARSNFNMRFAEQLLEHSKKPFKTFKTQIDTEGNSKDDTVNLVFDHGRNPIHSMSNYLTKSDVNLLCLNRTTENSKTKSDIKNVINQVNVSLLISER